MTDINHEDAKTLFREWRTLFGMDGPVKIGMVSQPVERLANAAAYVEQLEAAASRIRSCLLDKPEAVEGEPVAWPIDTDDQVEALARECEWDNRKYMTPKDYAIWCERMRKFARLASPVTITEEMREAAHAVLWDRDKVACSPDTVEAALRAALRTGEGGYIDSHSRDALIAGALQRADAREALFPEMSSRIKAEREQARRKAFEEAAAIAEEFHFMKDIEWWLNSTKKEISAETCLLLAAAIRQRAEEEGR